MLNLPTDFSRPPVTNYEGNAYVFLLPRMVLRKLFFLAQTEGATLYTALLAVYMVLLHRYTGQTDLLVGSPMACRNKLGFKNVVGDFVNTVVMRGKESCLSAHPPTR